MKSSRKELGNWGENLAVDYLKERDYSIVDRNLRTPYGELDIIALQRPIENSNISYVKQDQTLMIVFVEVKTRASTAFGTPEESINAQKRRHLIDSAFYYMQSHPELDYDWRIDVIAIRKMGNDPKPEITHFENAIMLD